MQPDTSSRATLLYAIVYAGAIGSAVIATLFLALDTVAGRPLETPILMGSALFVGELPSSGASLRLDLAAGYSLAHLLMFTLVGGVFALVAQRLRSVPALPTMLLAGIFLTLTTGIVTLNALVRPDLFAVVGVLPIVFGNLLSSGAMTAFYVHAFEIGDVRLPVPSTLIGDSE